jgi:PBP1b-binding outer membrane lipoprotein LpoB
MKKMSVMAFVLAAAFAVAGCSKNKKPTPTNTGGSNATEMKTDGDKPAGGDTAQKPDSGTANGGADPCAGPSK